jgi:hypothetical protein
VMPHGFKDWRKVEQPRPRRPVGPKATAQQKRLILQFSKELGLDVGLPQSEEEGRIILAGLLERRNRLR